MRSEASRLEASLKAVNRQLSVSQAAFISAESACNKSGDLVDTEAQMRQDLEEILPEVW